MTLQLKIKIVNNEGINSEDNVKNAKNNFFYI